MFHFAKLSSHLIALAAGVALFIYIKNQNKIKNLWPKIAAWAIIALSSLSILCSIIFSFMFWNDGFYSHHRMKEYRRMMDYLQDKKSSDMSQELKNDAIIQKETPAVAEVKTEPNSVTPSTAENVVVSQEIKNDNKLNVLSEEVKNDKEINTIIQSKPNSETSNLEIVK